MKILIAYLKKETVLCIAVLLAAFSMLLIHPDSKYSGYMDLPHLGAFVFADDDYGGL